MYKIYGTALFEQIVCVFIFCHATRILTMSDWNCKLIGNTSCPASNLLDHWIMHIFYLRIWFCGKVISRMQIFCFSSMLGNKYRIFHWARNTHSQYTFGENNANAASATQFPDQYAVLRAESKKNYTREQQRLRIEKCLFHWNHILSLLCRI